MGDLVGLLPPDDSEPTDRELLQIVEASLQVAVDTLLEISIRTAMRDHPSKG